MELRLMVCCVPLLTRTPAPRLEKIALPITTSFWSVEGELPGSIVTPSSPLNAITFRGAISVPPMVVL
jgi:hypothetical protein